MPGRRGAPQEQQEDPYPRLTAAGITDAADLAFAAGVVGAARKFALLCIAVGHAVHEVNDSRQSDAARSSRTNAIANAEELAGDVVQEILALTWTEKR